MAESTPPTSRQVTWLRRDDSAEVYSNYFFVNWSAVDVRIRFGQLIPVDNVASEDKVAILAEDQASVTMAWPQVKSLYDAIGDALRRYEKANGAIDLTQLRLPE